MDPNTGKLYPGVQEAKEAGVENPVELRGREEDILRISNAVKKVHNKEQKRSKRKKAKAARKAAR